MVFCRACFVRLASVDIILTKRGILDDLWLRPRASLESTVLQTCGKCHLDGNQMRIKPHCTLVCFQEVSQLATEEVSIFRLMGPTDLLSSLVVRQLDPGSKVCMFLCTRGTDYTCVFVPFLVCLYVWLCVDLCEDDFFLTRELCILCFCWEWCKRAEMQHQLASLK